MIEQHKRMEQEWDLMEIELANSKVGSTGKFYEKSIEESKLAYRDKGVWIVQR